MYMKLPNIIHFILFLSIAKKRRDISLFCNTNIYYGFVEFSNEHSSIIVYDYIIVGYAYYVTRIHQFHSPAKNI